MNGTDYLTRYQGIGPRDLAAYEKMGGFTGLRKALSAEPASVIETVRRARLAGRGGAGFDAGTKWSTVPKGEPVHVVCNADEGEPGTFKDRFLLRTAPLLVIDGLITAGYAVGASQGSIYVRGEYPEVIEGLEAIIALLEERGYLGEDVLGSGFSFTLSVMRGGGSYVVGDETALLSSLMGRRGYPLAKPPYPTEHGLWDKPTVVNNVETLACVPLILSNGPDWFAGIGNGQCPGPKLFSVSGHVAKPGVYEFPMGVRLAEVLEVAMRFFSEESCGQCFSCRYGTRQLEYMANRIAVGEGRPEYPRLMRETVESMYDDAFCPFGQSTRLPLLTLLDTFGQEIGAEMVQQQYVKEVV